MEYCILFVIELLPNVRYNEKAQEKSKELFRNNS